MKKTNANTISFPLFLVPFVIWLGIFQAFYRGGLCVHDDAWGYFDHIKYFLDNIQRGVYPLWDPFSVWGRTDDLAVRWIGEFNPLLFLIVVLTKSGLSFALSYFVYWIGYYFLGVTGYYLLAKEIFKDARPAYLSMLLLLFSSQGATLFNDNATVLLFVPSAWFFYFLVAFLRFPRRCSALGLTFCSMILAITYMPFYFLTVFLCLAIVCALLFPRQLARALKGALTFGQGHPWLTIVCVGSLALSLLPGIWWYLAAGGGEYAVGWRHSGAASQNVAGLSLQTAGQMGAVGPFPLMGLFTHLRELEVGYLSVPVFAFLVLGAGGVLKLTRRLVVFSSVGVFLALTAMTSATPIHEFLYRHVPYFKIIRNMHYFVWLALPVFMLAAAEILNQFLDWSGTAGKRTRGFMGGYLLIVHLFAFWFLARQEGTLFSAYVCVAGSLLFWIVLLLEGFNHYRFKMLILLLLCVSCHPLEVLTALASNSDSNPIPYDAQRFEPRFAYVRPQLAEESIERGGVLRYISDTTGYVVQRQGGHKYIGTRFSYQLHEKSDPAKLEEYTRYKFIVTDRVEAYDDEDEVLPRVLSALYKNENIAFIPRGQAAVELAKVDMGQATALKISGPLPELEVVEFDVNHIRLRTDFSSPKFLVYNDSFHSGWRVRVNDAQQPLLRANLAFKGVALPAGENDIVFSFGSPARHVLNGFLFFYFAGFLMMVVVLYVRGPLFRQQGESDAGA